MGVAAGVGGRPGVGVEGSCGGECRCGGRGGCGEGQVVPERANAGCGRRAS